MTEEKPKVTPKKRGRVPSKRKIGKDIVSNQWQGDERQLKWLDLYMNPKNKDTYANIYQSAISAGYSEASARSIPARQWVQSAMTIMRTMNPEHIRGALEEIALSKDEKASDRLQALKMLGTDQGMFVQKQVTAHIGLEEALEALE